MRGDALEESESIAHAVRGGGRELRRVEERVDRDDLLDQGRHDTCRAAIHVSAAAFLQAEELRDKKTREGEKTYQTSATGSVPARGLALASC